jgi:hypothetical protein
MVLRRVGLNAVFGDTAVGGLTLTRHLLGLVFGTMATGG